MSQAVLVSLTMSLTKEIAPRLEIWGRPALPSGAGQTGLRGYVDYPVARRLGGCRAVPLHRGEGGARDDAGADPIACTDISEGMTPGERGCSEGMTPGERGCEKRGSQACSFAVV